MFSEDQEGPGEAAIGFADQFVDAGRAKLDAVFGAGYAAQNPQALAAYIAACASNLNAFMVAAAGLAQEASFDEAFAAFEEDHAPDPEPKKPRRRR